MSEAYEGTAETVESEAVEAQVSETVSEDVETVTDSQELAEQTNIDTRESVIDKYGGYMSTERVSELKSGGEMKTITVMDSNEYHRVFSNKDRRVLGHCNAEGEIYLKDGSEDAIKHVVTHETMHQMSDKRTFVEGDEVVRTSGLLESRFREGAKVSEANRAANEGITEMHTLRELYDRGEESAAHSVAAYSESRAWAERIEGLVGEERINAAYFGGERESFEESFNRLNDNNPNAWRCFSKDLDILQYSEDPEARRKAQGRIQETYTTMVKNRYGWED